MFTTRIFSVCGDYTTGLPTFTSTGQYLFLEFFSDSSNDEAGWAANFATVAKSS